MINAVSLSNTRQIQSTSPINAPENLSGGQALQPKIQEGRFDTVELSNNNISRSPLLDVPSEIKTVKPRSWSISIETINSRIGHIEGSLEKADSLNLSFGDRLNYLKNDGMSWVEELKQSDPEMFVEWLKMNKENIEGGRPDLASLSSDFTMDDYHFYVKEPFSVLV